MAAIGTGSVVVDGFSLLDVFSQDMAGGSVSTADEIEKLARLRAVETITGAEFEMQNAKLLA